jgi:hypothetical protein
MKTTKVCLKLYQQIMKDHFKGTFLEKAQKQQTPLNERKNAFEQNLNTSPSSY